MQKRLEKLWMAKILKDKKLLSKKPEIKEQWNPNTVINVKLKAIQQVNVDIKKEDTVTQVHLHQVVKNQIHQVTTAIKKEKKKNEKNLKNQKPKKKKSTQVSPIQKTIHRN